MFQRGEPYFYLFDILWMDGVGLRDLPLLQRKAMPREIIPAPPDHVEGQGVELSGAALVQGCEARAGCSPRRSGGALERSWTSSFTVAPSAWSNVSRKRSMDSMVT